MLRKRVKYTLCFNFTEAGTVESKGQSDFTAGSKLEEIVVCGHEEDVKNVIHTLNQQLQVIMSL